MAHQFAILFDLDGTLLDSAPDLIGALSQVLIDEGKTPAGLADYRPYVGQGVGGMIQQSFGLAVDDPIAKPLQQKLIQYYRQRLDHETQFFDGIPALLDELDTHQTPWGIVTNKISSLTLPLLEKMGLMGRAHCVVCGDTTAERKPSPMPLLHACDVASLSPETTVYIGDDIRDVQAANYAGMRSLAASYGYLHENDDASNWGAEGVVSHPEQIIVWLD